MSNQLTRRIAMRRAAPMAMAIIIAVFVFLRLLTGNTWTAIAVVLLMLFSFVVALAAYFWSALFMGGTTSLFRRKRTATPWSIGDPEAGLPEYDMDPGLELMAAGMLVYRMGQVRPDVHFRKVSLADARSVRPFVVARTGDERPHEFMFVLSDESEQARYEETLRVNLGTQPQLIMSTNRLAFSRPAGLVGQRWTLQVRSGVTVVTSFRFMFSSGLPGNSESTPGPQEELLRGLLDDALKLEVGQSTPELVMED